MIKRFEFEVEPGRRSNDHGQIRYSVWEIDGHGDRVKCVTADFGSRYAAVMEFERVARHCLDDDDVAAPPETPATIDAPATTQEVAS